MKFVFLLNKSPVPYNVSTIFIRIIYIPSKYVNKFKDLQNNILLFYGSVSGLYN